MSRNIESAVTRWRDAGVVDAETAQRILAYESREVGKQRFSLPVLLAITFGALLVGAGVLMWVAAHWDNLSPAQRFSLTLLMIVVFHGSGAFLHSKFENLGRVLHVVGTVALGGGIALAGQIFNLQEHWPGGVMLWAMGAALAWWILKDWAQGVLVALLTPAWLLGEWQVATEHLRAGERVGVEALLLLAFVYLAARAGDDPSPLRRALVWIGGLGLLPSIVAVLFLSDYASSPWHYRGAPDVPASMMLLGYLMGFGGALIVAWLLRRREAVMSAVFALWVGGLASFAIHTDQETNPMIYLWCALGACLLIYWGVRDARKERVNLGVAGFALTVMAFYFSFFYDMMGRAMGMISVGVLFLLGGWYLEKFRRQLVARVQEAK